MKQVIVSITLCFLIQYSSASIFDGLKEAMSSVEDNLGKLLGDVITDVKETIDCSILAMEKAINFSGIFPVPAENDKCRGDTEPSVIPTDVRDEPLSVESVTNATKQITGRIDESLSIVNKSLHDIIIDESEIDIELNSAKQVLVSESDRLFKIDDLLQDTLKNRTSHTNNSTSTTDIKSLQVKELDKTSPRARDVKSKVLDEVLDVLDIETVVSTDKYVMELLVKGPETTTKLPGLGNTTKLLAPEAITKPPDPKISTQHMGSKVTTIIWSPESTAKFSVPQITTNIPGPETTTKHSGPEITTKLPGPETTTNLPGTETTTKRPGPETTTKLPGLGNTTKLLAPEAITKPPDPKITTQHMGSKVTTIIRSPEPTTKFPVPQIITNIPGPETTTKHSGPEITTKLPGPETTTNLPGTETTTKRPGSETTTKLPGTETTTKHPDPETTTKHPGPEATTKILGLTTFPVSASETKTSKNGVVTIKTNIDDEKDNTNSASQTTVTNPPPKTFKQVATSIMYKQTTDVNSQTLLITTSQTTPPETATTEIITASYTTLNFNSFDLDPPNSESRKQAIEDAQNLIENSKYSEILMEKYLNEAEQDAVDIFGNSGFQNK